MIECGKEMDLSVEVSGLMIDQERVSPLRAIELRSLDCAPAGSIASAGSIAFSQAIWLFRGVNAK